MQKKPHRWSTVLPSHSLWGNWVHRRALTFPRFWNLSGDTEFPLYCMSFIMPHFLCTAVEYLVTFQNHFRKLAVSYQVKYILILKLSNSASRNLPRGIENIMAWKKNVHRSCIHNSPDWKKISMSNNRQMDTQVVLHLYDGAVVTSVDILAKFSWGSKEKKGRFSSLGLSPRALVLLATLLHFLGAFSLPLVANYFLPFYNPSQPSTDYSTTPSFIFPLGW